MRNIAPYLLSIAAIVGTQTASAADLFSYLKSHAARTMPDLKMGSTVYALDPKVLPLPDGFSAGMLAYTELNDGKPKYLALALCKETGGKTELTYLVDENADKTIDKTYRAAGANCEEAYAQLNKRSLLPSPSQETLGWYQWVIAELEQQAKRKP